MEITSNVIRFSGKAELASPLEVGKDYKVEATGSITKSELHDNEDNTLTQIFTFCPALSEITDELGAKVKIKDARSMGQKLRAVIRGEWMRDDCGMSAEEYYEREMGRILAERLTNL